MQLRRSEDKDVKIEKNWKFYCLVSVEDEAKYAPESRRRIEIVKVKDALQKLSKDTGKFS